MVHIQVMKIYDAIQSVVTSFDYIERITKSRYAVLKVNGKEYRYKEYLVHCEPGKYDAVLVFKLSDGSIDIDRTSITVYIKNKTRYFTYTPPKEDGRELIYVFMNKIE